MPLLLVMKGRANVTIPAVNESTTTKSKSILSPKSQENSFRGVVLCFRIGSRWLFFLSLRINRDIKAEPVKCEPRRTSNKVNNFRSNLCRYTIRDNVQNKSYTLDFPVSRPSIFGRRTPSNSSPRITFRNIPLSIALPVPIRFSDDLLHTPHKRIHRAHSRLGVIGAAFDGG